MNRAVIVLAALAVPLTTGGEIDQTLDRTVAPASDPLGTPAQQGGGDLNAPVVNSVPEKPREKITSLPFQFSGSASWNFASSGMTPWM